MLLVPSYWNTSLSTSFFFSEMDIGFDIFQCHQHSEIQQIQISQSSGCTTAQGKNLNNLKDSERFVVKLYWEPWVTNEQWMDPLPSCMKCFTTQHILSHSWSGKADFKFELLKVENSWQEYRIKALFPTNNLLNYLKLWWISTMKFWLCWMQTDVSCAKVLQKEFYHLCCCHVSIKGKNKLKSFVMLHTQGIESRLKVTLPDDLPASLADGVVLCHLINHIRKGLIPSIHIPSAGVVSIHHFIIKKACIASYALFKPGHWVFGSYKMITKYFLLDGI